MRAVEYHGSPTAVLRSAAYWTPYILLKHASEACALATQLLVSSAIKSYDGRQTFAVRHSPLAGPQALYSTPSERTPLVSAGGKEGDEAAADAAVVAQSSNFSFV